MGTEKEVEVTVQQVFLRSGKTGTGHREMVCWLDASKLSTNSVVTLKGVEGKWRVIDIFSKKMEIDQINRKWKVGGL